MGTTMKKIMKKRGLTYAAVARTTGMNASDVSRIARGLAVPYEGQARKIAIALHWEGDRKALFEPAGEEATA